MLPEFKRAGRPIRGLAAALVLGVCPGLAAAQDESAWDSLREGVALRAQAGDLEGAIVSLRALTERHPAFVEAHLELAVSLAFAGQLDAALAVYAPLTTAHPDDARVLDGHARVLHWTGDHAAARAMYERSLQAAPDGLEAHRGLGDVARAERDWGAARRHYERVLESQPDDAAARDGLAAVERARDVALRVQGGVWAGEQGVSPTGTANARWTLDPAWSLNALASGRMVRGFGDDGRPDAEGFRLDLGVGAAVQVVTELNLEFGALVSAGDDPTRIAAPLRASIRLASEWTLLVGVRPGVREDLRVEHLSDLGIQFALPSEGFVMLRAFRYDDSDGFATTAGSLSVRIVPVPWLRLEPTASAALAGQDPVVSVGGEVLIAVTPDTQLGVSYEAVIGPQVRHRAELVWTQEL